MTKLGLAQRDTPLALMPVLLVVIVSPILEEIVFRGALQGWLLTQAPLQRSIAGISLANGLTSLVFAAMHMLRQPPLWAALVFVPSLIFGWARERHDNLLSPIGLHVFYNAGFIYIFG